MKLGTKSIPLTKGKFAVVDDADYPALSQYSWMFCNGYAYRKIGRAMIAMHREIAGAAKGEHVDHISGNTMDNRRENLRICSNAQNSWNRPGRAGLSQYKGVSRDHRTGRWYARIGRKHIGSYASEIEAAHAFDEAAKALQGEFAWLNFPDSKQFDRAAHTEAVTPDSEIRLRGGKPRAKRIVVTCEVCGKEVIRTEFYATRYKHTYCSRACLYRFQREAA